MGENTKINIKVRKKKGGAVELDGCTQYHWATYS